LEHFNQVVAALASLLAFASAAFFKTACLTFSPSALTFFTVWPVILANAARAFSTSNSFLVGDEVFFGKSFRRKP
jgi:hypothetical protein